MILMMTVAEGGGEKVMMGMMSVSGERSNFYLLPQSEVVPAFRGSFRTKNPLFLFLFGAEIHKDTQKNLC